MANIKSAKKAIRSSSRKSDFNEKVRKSYKKARKDLLAAIKNKDKEKANKMMPNVMKTIDKAAQKKVIHKNTAARYKSRLAKAMNKIEA